MSTAPRKSEMLDLINNWNGVPDSPPCIGIVSSTAETCSNGDVRISDCVGDGEDCTEWIRASATLNLEDWR